VVSTRELYETLLISLPRGNSELDCWVSRTKLCRVVVISLVESAVQAFLKV
jgi:hypothetical protein